MTSGPKIKIASAPVFSGDAKAIISDTTAETSMTIAFGLSFFCKDAIFPNRTIPDHTNKATITVIGSNILI